MPLNKRVRRRLVLLSVLVVVVVAALASLFFLSRWNRNREVERSANEGLAAYESGDYLSALEKLSYAVTHRKDDVELALALGDTRFRNTEASGRHLRAAAKYYQHALGLDPNNEQALQALVEIYRMLGDSANVLAYSDKLPEDDSDAIRARIAVLGGSGRTEDALVDVARLRDIEPNNPSWVMLEFELRRRQEETLDSMLVQLDELAETYPNNQGILFVRIPLLRQAGQPEQAIREARQFANLNSIDKEAILPLLRQLESLQMTDEAQLVLTQALELAQSNADIAHALVQRLWLRGAYSSALALALESATVFPDDLRFLRIAAASSSLVPEESDSEQLYERFLTESRSQDTARAEIDVLLVEGLRARRLSDITDLRAGIASVEAARRLDPRSALLRFLEADLLSRTGQTSAATNAYIEVFEQSRSQVAGIRLVNLLLRQQQNSDAVFYAKQLLLLYPTIDIYALKARAWIGMKRSGQDPASVDGSLADGSTIAETIQETYTKANETSPRRATILLPLIASAAAIEGNEASIAYVVNEALENNYTTSAQLLQILTFEENLGGSRSDELLHLADSRGATPFNIALILAQQARESGDEAAAFAILDDAHRQIDKTSGDDLKALRQILTFVVSTSEPNDLTLEKLDEIFSQLPRDPSAARVVASYPNLWTTSPELAQKALDQIDQLLGSDSYAYVISNARRVMSLSPTDSAARASALVELDELVLKSPNSIEGMLLMSDLLRSGESPDLSGSVNYLRRALEARPDQVQLYPTLIQLLQQIGDRERALEYLTRYQKLASDTSAARSRVALFVRQGELNRAIEELLLLAEESKDPLDRIALGQFLARENRVDAALEQYDLALELDPENRFALDGKILLLAATGRLRDAFDLIAESTTLDDRGRLMMQIEANLAASQFEEASRTSDALIEMAPQSVDTWVLTGRVRAQVNDLTGARSALRQALEIDPDNSVAIGQLVPLLVARPASWDDARALLPRLETSSPALAAVLELTMAASNPADSSFAPSSEHLTRSIEIIRSYPGAIGPRRLAWTLHTTAGDHATAFQIAQEALDSMSSNPIPAQWALESALRSRNWDEAIEMAYEVRNRNPVGSRLKQELQVAELCLNLGRTSEALITLEQFAPIIADEDAIYLNVPIASRSAEAKTGLLTARLRSLLMQALLMNGRVDRAYTIYGPILGDHPNLVTLWLSVVPSMEPSDARAGLQRIQPVSDSSPKGLLELSQTWARLAASTRDPSDIDRASELADRLTRDHPSVSRDGRLLQAQLAEISGDMATSMAIHRALIDEHTSEEIALIQSYSSLPEDQHPTVARKRLIYATALNNLAYQSTQVEDGDRDRALMDINKALECAPPALKPEFLDTKASILLALGDQDAALQTINQAGTLAPQRIDFQIRAVRILMSLKRPEEARERAGEVLMELDRTGRGKSAHAEELNLLIEEIG